MLRTTYPDHLPQIELGINYLISQIKSGGSFGHSTQATVLALKALIRYQEMQKADVSCDGCQFEFWVNGEFKQSITYNESETTKVEFYSVISPTLVN